MKWIFRSIFLTLAVFILVMIAGAFKSQELIAEKEISIGAAHEDVFYYLNDLTIHPEWSPWLSALDKNQIVYGGPSSGVGQTMAWKTESGDVGSQTIMESVDGAFIRTDLVAKGQSVLATYAIADNEQGGVTVLLSTDMNLGGFPYVQRLFAGRYEAQMEADISSGLTALKGLVETELSLED